MFFRRYNIAENNIDISNEILNGNLIVHKSWKPIETKKIDWTMDPYKDGTWCFYLHSLDMICYLMNSYELTGQSKYLTQSKKIIKSWINNNIKKSDNLSPFAWKDHSVANRVINLIHFYTYYKKSNEFKMSFEQEILEALRLHGEYLVKDENHTFGNNHGIFQDRSLIELAVIFPELPNAQAWYQKATERLKLHADKDISKSGVHLEHSDAYHIIVMKLFTSIYKFLVSHDKVVLELEELIVKMQGFLAYAYKPDFKIPMNGDSGPDGIGFLKEKDIVNNELLYLRTRGKAGQSPDLVKHYEDIGTIFIRNNWRFDDKQLYFRIFSGFHSKVHKHADDLSFVLSIGKTDFFVDSGKYNYQEQNEYRKYFRSTMAHNTITVNNQSYEIENKQIGKSKIEKHLNKSDVTYIRAQHNMYSGVVFKRNILYLKEYETFLIYDELKSNKVKTYSQIYNIGENVDVDVISKNHVILKSKVDKNKIELIQLNRIPQFREYHGEINPIAGWYSDKFNQKKPITQIRFSAKDQIMDYKTIINTKPNIGVKRFTVTKLNNYISFNIEFKNNEYRSIKLPY